MHLFVGNMDVWYQSSSILQWNWHFMHHPANPHGGSVHIHKYMREEKLGFTELGICYLSDNRSILHFLFISAMHILVYLFVYINMNILHSHCVCDASQCISNSRLTNASLTKVTFHKLFYEKETVSCTCAFCGWLPGCYVVARVVKRVSAL